MLLLTVPYRGHFICFLMSFIRLRNLAKHFGQELLGFGRQNLITKWIRKFFSYPTSLSHKKNLVFTMKKNLITTPTISVAYTTLAWIHKYAN